MLKKSIIVFNNKYYQQNSGITMGNNASVQLGNLYMSNLEYELINKYYLLASLSFYKRYIDDLFMIWSGSFLQLLKFQEEFNNLHSNINLTFSQSKTNQVFLDLEVYKSQKNNTLSLLTKTYQKQLNKYLYIPFKSYHSQKMHRGWITAELKRYKYQCSDPEEYRKIRLLFYNRLRARGFPPSFLNNIFFDDDNTNAKHRIAPNLGRRRKLTLTLPFKPSFSNMNPKQLIQKYFKNENIITAWKRSKNLRDILTNSIL
jgi:hypothetical protein